MNMDMDNDISGLDSADLGVRARAIRRIATTGAKTTRAFSKLFDMTLGAAGFAERQYARVALFSFSTEAVPLLLDRSRATQGDRRFLAVCTLSGLGGAGHLLEVLPRRRNPAWGAFAPDVVARCIELLRDERRDVRLAAAVLLAECGDAIEEATEVLADQARELCSAESMSDQQVADANLIAVHLGRIGPTAGWACEALKHFTHSQDKFLALAARKAREQIGCAD
jgi:hypothetical protein